MQNMYKFNPIVTLPIQFFAGAEDFDVEAAEAAIEAEPEVEIDDSLDPEVDIPDESEDLDELTDEPEDSEPETPDISTDDGRDEAFANLRRERDQLATDAEFIRQFAESNGMTVAELREQHAQAQLEKQAEKEGVPVEILKRLNNMEQENAQVKEQAQAERLNSQITATLAKYKGTDVEFKATLEYAAQNGMIDLVKSGAVTFEALYKLAHMDTLVESAKKNAVQDDLSTRKKRQQEASIAAGSQTQVAETSDMDDQAAADAKEILEQYDF